MSGSDSRYLAVLPRDGASSMEAKDLQRLQQRLIQEVDSVTDKISSIGFISTDTFLQPSSRSPFSLRYTISLRIHTATTGHPSTSFGHRLRQILCVFLFLWRGQDQRAYQQWAFRTCRPLANASRNGCEQPRPSDHEETIFHASDTVLNTRRNLKVGPGERIISVLLVVPVLL